MTNEIRKRPMRVKHDALTALDRAEAAPAGATGDSSATLCRAAQERHLVMLVLQLR